MSLLTKYRNIFAWSYKEIPRLNQNVAVHHLTIKPGYLLIKQAQRHFRPKLIPQIEVEVNKLIEEGFIHEVKYPTWIANVVPVRKKNGQLHVMSFRLKNVGATYQCAMQKELDDMLNKHIKCYVDDLVVKSKRRHDHLKDLKVVFDRLQKYQQRMNLLKCTFGVTSKKFLGFTAFTVHLIAKADPIKYVLSRPIIFGRLAKWVVLL
ncbi:hypothetical protein E5676_scaffold2030G00030 [Cucumis melo var. makuwa]|uniref:Reverse transcriptase domain-containing protein n=1 Tax=Cucumis melo var. makuwa TaxID=1194695 RepID=A0A5A7VE18_CUCMM|nr:hypothetical protein E6C27_scaffold548G00670 [Cucumis melo var. makuwa]TYK28594.1 hypothetical protein E5676_scaffold2030G00030 [Cucumis melo var. makuwa]